MRLISTFHAHRLLADRGSAMFRNMGEGFRHKQETFNPAELVLWFLLLVGAFWALGALSRYLTRRDKRRLYDSPRRLFRALCRAHELDRASRRLLKQLALFHRLPIAAQIFLRPDCFAPRGLSPALRAQGARLAALDRKLFGTLPRVEEEPAAPGTWSEVTR